MDFNKIINEQRKNLENKEKRKELFDKASTKLQSFADLGAKKVNSLMETTKEFVDKKQADLENMVEVKFSKSIYGDCIDFVDYLIVDTNLKQRTTVVIVSDESLENESNISVQSIIRKVAPRTVDPTIYIQADGYVDGVFNAIANHFKQNAQLEVEVGTLTISIVVKEVAEPVVEEESVVDEVKETSDLDLNIEKVEEVSTDEVTVTKIEE